MIANVQGLVVITVAVLSALSVNKTISPKKGKPADVSFVRDFSICPRFMPGKFNTSDFDTSTSPFSRI